MTAKDIKIWIWVQNTRIFKAISNKESGTITIYDEFDNIVLRRTGLSKQQVKTIHLFIGSTTCRSEYTFIPSLEISSKNTFF
jgi:hypothetical protein